MTRVRTGADALCAALAGNGVEHLFGVPGTQSIDLWEALRRASAPQPLVATNELAAGFMANGYARASGRVGVVATIPGPGFTYALTPLAEARLDSAPVVHVVGAPARREDGAPALQAIRQADIAGPLVKGVVTVDSVDQIGPAVAEAVRLAGSGEPGPVLLQISETALGAAASRGGRPAEAFSELRQSSVRPPEVDAVVERLAAARRPLLFCGQGAQGSADGVRELAAKLRAPVLTTTSGRGVVAEGSSWSLPFDSPGASVAPLNRLVGEADVVFALGVKFSHNGSFGFALRVPPELLIRVDASSAASPAYPAGLTVEADVADAVRWLADSVTGDTQSRWREEEVAEWRGRLVAAAMAVPEPRLGGRHPAAFFADLRATMPESAVLATDSGLHQYITRRHLQVLAPRTLLVPANFQSMGFGLPAAIGAAVATGQVAAAVIGDGGFAIGALELATAVRAAVPLVAVVFVDGSFGLIRLQQLRRTGHTSGVELPPIDVRLIAEAVGAEYSRVDGENALPVLARAFGSGAVTVVEVAADGAPGRARARGLATSAARSVLGPGASGRLMDAARRRRT